MKRILSCLALLAPLALPLASLSGCNRPANCPPAAVPTSSGAPGAAGDSSTVVAMIGTQPVTMAELDKSAAAKLYEVREQALESLISDRILEPAAKKENLPVDQFIRKQVEAKVPLVSEKEAADFFEKNKERMPPQFRDKKFEEVKNEIVQGLTGQKRQEAVGGIIDEIRAKAGVKILLQAPKVEVAAVGPSKGPADAKVTIVEFSDFQCPFCSRGRQTIDEVTKAYGDKVRVVFRDFPLSFHENAKKAAEAGQCANEQGKFWAMHDWMFDNQKSLEVPNLKEAAKKLGLDSAKFDQCLTSGKFASAVEDNIKAGTTAGVRGTPAFFVNGVFLNGALPFDKFKTEIDRALAQ
jgi:protein-disulfide isomerase